MEFTVRVFSAGSVATVVVWADVASFTMFALERVRALAHLGHVGVVAAKIIKILSK